MLPITQEKVDEAPTFHITRPKDLSALEGARPVVAWANGGCFRSDFSWQPLFDRWASAGFIVLSLTGTGSDDDIEGMLGMTAVAEHGALLDWAVKANESGAYAGKLDLERMVLSGNSCGGVTALGVAAQDKRAAAVFVLSGSSALGSVDKEIMKSITIPVGYVVGNMSEDVAAPNAADDYDAMQDGIPALLVNRTMGDHLTVSTDAMILPQDAEIALNWMDLALFGNKQAHDMLMSPAVCNGCTANTWVVKSKHLDKLLK